MLSAQRALVPGFVIGTVLDMLVLTVAQFAVAALAGLTVVAAVRAGQLFVSPIIVIY